MAVTGAIFKALTFNGESSRNYGVYITGQAVYNAPNRDVEMITIPGRSGSFPLDHGRYENIEVTYPAGVFADNEDDFAELISDFRNMLCSANGYCRLEDEYNPDEYRMAVYKSGLEVDPTLLKAGEFEITFECKPQRYLKSGEEPVTMGDWTDVETHTGNPIMFTVDKDEGQEVKNLDVELTPIQDLHGYDKPWSAGAGKNIGLLSDDNIGNHSNSTVTYLDGGATVTVTGGYGRTGWLIPVTNGTTYTISLYALVSDTSTGHTNRIYIGNTDSVWNVSTTGYKTHFALTGTRTKYTYTFTADTSQIFIGAYIGGSAGDGSGTITELQVEQGSTATTYEPYSNICPITGHDSVTITDTGKNLFDPQKAVQDSASSQVTIDGDWITFRTDGSRLVYNYTVDGAVTLSAIVKSDVATSNAIRFYAYYSDGTNAMFAGVTTTDTNEHYLTGTTNANKTLVRIQTAWTDSKAARAKEIQLEYGSTASTYEPFTSQSKTVTLPHTVYGADVDVTGGASKETWQNIASYNGETISEPWLSSMDEYVSGTTPTTGAQVTYKLATPLDLSTTPTDITLYNGDNVISSDGDMTMEIGKKITGVDNPTRFESSPEVRVKGYGTVAFNGYEIVLNNVVYGDVILAEDKNEPSGIFDLGSDVYANNGDPLTIVVNPAAIIRAPSAPISYADNESASSNGTHKFVIESNITAKISFNGSTFSFTKGTSDSGSIYAQYDVHYVNKTSTVRVTFTITYNATADTIAITTALTSSPYTFTLRGTEYILASARVDSSKSVLGDPTIIDCENGEAYKVDADKVVPLNRYVDLGTDLPKFATGENPITTTGSITECVIIPRWWKL